MFWWILAANEAMQHKDTATNQVPIADMPHWFIVAYTVFAIGAAVFIFSCIISEMIAGMRTL